MLDELESKVSGRHTLSSGSRLPVLRGVDSTGRFTRVDSDQDLLLITVNRACLGTQLNVESWQEAVTRLRSAGISTVWVTADSAADTEKYLRERALEGLVLGDVPFDVYAAVGLGVVPQTAVVSRGTVTAAWTGPVKATQIMAAFGTTR